MDMSGSVTRAVYVLRAPSLDTMADTSVLSFEVDALYTDMSDDVSCADGLATLVIDDVDIFGEGFPDLVGSGATVY